jgi:hypothetical protein
VAGGPTNSRRDKAREREREKGKKKEQVQEKGNQCSDLVKKRKKKECPSQN